MNVKKLLCYLLGHKWSITHISVWGGPTIKRRSSILNRKGGKKRAIYSSYGRKTKICYYCTRCGKLSNKNRRIMKKYRIKEWKNAPVSVRYTWFVQRRRYLFFWKTINLFRTYQEAENYLKRLQGE